MLTAVLTVLKIIGIILLIVLFLILVILFVPIRYSLDAEIPRKDLSDGIDEHITDGVSCNIRVSWLLHLIRAEIRYPAATFFSVKILFFTIFPKKIKKKNKSVKNTVKGSGKKAGSSYKQNAEAEPGSDEEPISFSNELPETKIPSEEKSGNWEKFQPEKTIDAVPDIQLQEKDDEEKENGKKEDEQEKKKSTQEQEDNEQHNKQNEETEAENGTLFLFWRKCRDIVLHIWNFLKNQQNVLQKTWYTISRICDRISLIKETLESDTFQRAWKIASSQLLKVWRQLRPGICDITVLYGTGDPALTAQIMGIYATMYPFLPEGISIDADFDDTVIGCTAHIRGRITLFRLLWCAAVIYFNKDIKKVYRRFRRIMKR